MNMQHAAGDPRNFNGYFRVVAMDQQGCASPLSPAFPLSLCARISMSDWHMGHFEIARWMMRGLSNSTASLTPPTRTTAQHR